jgi:hypothetical protein
MQECYKLKEELNSDRGTRNYVRDEKETTTLLHNTLVNINASQLHNCNDNRIEVIMVKFVIHPNLHLLLLI